MDMSASEMESKPFRSFRNESKRDTQPTLLEIINEVVPDWAPHWRWLGIELKVSYSSIRIIQHDSYNDCVNCCTKMLTEWLDRCPTASWGDLIDAVDKLSSYGDKDFQEPTDLLRQHYKQKRFTPPQDEWPPYYPDHYIPLTIVHHERQCTEKEIAAVAQEFLVKGGRSYGQEKNIQSKRINSIDELFYPFEGDVPHPFIILIEGAPGIGKTHLSKEIAMRWAKRTILHNTKLLFLIRISNPQVKKITGIPSLVNHFFEDSAQANIITKWLEKYHGKNFTIVLDGFDEVSDNNKSDFINDIINRDKLTNCSLVILSRPTASSHLHNIVNCRAEILGFTEENRQSFIQNSLHDDDKIKKIEDFLQSNPFLNSLCYIPLYLNILLCLTKDGTSELPKTQTKLFEKFVIMTIIHFLKKEDKEVSSATIHNFGDLPSPYKENIMELSKFAFLAIQTDQLVFTHSEIKALCPDLNPSDWFKFGLLKPTHYFKHGHDHESYHFLHFAIQEFMAAYYIASPSLKSQELQCLLNETFFDAHYFNTWIMYVGITGGKTLEFKHFLSGRRLKIYSQMSQSSTISNKILNDKIKCLHLLHCLGEANHELLSSIGNIFQEEVIDLSHQSLSLTDIRTLAILLCKSHNKQWEKLNLSCCNIDDKACNTFCEILETQRTILKIKCIDISSNNIYWEAFTKLCKFFSLWNTEELIVSIDIIFNSAQMHRIGKFLDKVTNAIQVDSSVLVDGKLLFNYIPEYNWMIAVYVNECYIKCAKFYNCKLDYALVDKLKKFASDIGITKATRIDVSMYGSKKYIASKLVKIPTNIQTIRFCGSNLHSKGAYLLNFASATTYQNLPWCEQVADYLAAVLCYNGTQSCKSYLNTLPNMLADKVTQLVQNVSSTRTVDIVNNGISDKAIDDILTIVTHCNKLINLQIGGNSLQTPGAIKIAKAICNITNLTTLNLENNIISEEAADDIADVLSRNTKLQQLYLGGNNLRSAGAIKITVALQKTASLLTYSIENNNIGDEAAGEIATVLCHNRKLQRLYLGGNNLLAAGATEIVKALQNPRFMTAFGIQNNYIGDESADCIAAFLSQCIKLERLIIGGNEFQSIGFTIVINALESIITLKVFDIQDNIITSDENVDGISAIISQNKGLEELYLGGINLQSKGVTKIARALKNIITLIKLGLQNNNISNEVANNIADVLSQNQNLQELYLGDNDLRSEGAIIIARSLQSISTLRKLNIECNHIDGEAVDHIVAIAYYNPKLQDIVIGGNKLGEKGAEKIARALNEILQI